MLTILEPGGRKIKELLRDLNLNPRKALGQHFLLDYHVLQCIIDAAQVGPQDTVVEVGPGLGVLTRALAERAGRVVAVELDRDLALALQRAVSAQDNIRIVNADARSVELAELLPQGVSYKVVANLPYYAASPIVRRFLEAAHKPTRMVVMVQREVARNMAAAPGEMSLLSLAVQLYGRPRIVAIVPPRAFYPPPKVTSAVVSIDVYSTPRLPEEQVDGFFALARAGFSAPRKQLRNSLSHALGIPAQEAAEALERAGIDPRRRAETVSLEEWTKLYAVMREHASH